MQNTLDLITFEGPLYSSMTCSIILISLILGLIMTGQAGTEGSSTPAIKMGVGDQCHTLATLAPEKKQQDTSYMRLIGPWDHYNGSRKSRPPQGFESWNVQPVACHYATYTVPPTITQHIVGKFKRRLSHFSPITFIKLVST